MEGIRSPYIRRLVVEFLSLGPYVFGPISNQLGFVGMEAALFSEDTNPILMEVRSSLRVLK